MTGRNWKADMPTPEMQAERDARQSNAALRLGGAGRYWPTSTDYTAPTRPDGTLDVTGWCRDLDTWFNAGLEQT